MKIRNNKGITLIALVITIIVLLILAGVTISMVLGDDGIIAQAQSANKAQKNADEKDAIAVAIGEARTSEYLGVLSATEVTKKSGNTITFSAENPYTSSVRDIREFEASNGTKQYLPIPKGMAYAFGTIEEGAVVVDGEGNEFVWVPVDGGVVTSKLDDGKVYLVDNDNDKSDEPQANDIPSGVEDDYNDMKTSVSIYGGFYVGRYETSWTGSKVASVPNVTSMNGTTPIERVRDSDWDGTVDSDGANWYTFYLKQRELYANSSSVTSGMIYGSQWDAIMDWMSGVDNPNVSGAKYINDSTGMGHYCYDSNFNQITDEEEPIKTGSNPDYVVKNIFDLAGNYYELTQEASDSDYRFNRGGIFASNGSESPASYRDYGSPTSAHDYGSSRLQLYIK